MLVAFNAYAVTDVKHGKKVPPVVRRGFKEWPVSDVSADLEVGDRDDRMTATRVLAGGVLLGPVGMVLGGMARKDVTRGKLTLDLAGERAVVEFRGARDAEKALLFVDALQEAAAAR